MPQKALLVGVGAGLVSALLFASVSTGTVLGLFVLFFLSPFPVAIAGLGWGWTGAAAAAAAATLIVPVMTGTVRGAFYYALTVGIPTVWLCYLLLLNRPTGGLEPAQAAPVVEWYPIGRVIALTAALAGALTVFHLVILGGDTEAIRASLRELIERLVPREILSRSGGELSEADLNAATSVTLILMPLATAVSLMLKFLLNLWIAGRVTHASGRLIRPWPDLAAFTLPRFMALGLAAAVALLLVLPGFPRLVAISFAAAFVFAYLLLGLAIVHHVTRGNQYRPFLLFGLYAALLFLSPWSALLIAAIGLAEPFSPLRRRWPATPTT